MASWASIAKRAADIVPEDRKRDERIAVVDATALIKGISLEKICDRAVTVQEVLNEVHRFQFNIAEYGSKIRDKKSRHGLQTFPLSIQVIEPDAESIQTVVQFARETGDLPFLSIADVKILALTFYLEKRIYGTAHLSMNPVILTKSRSKISTQLPELPGWGTINDSKDWESLDHCKDSTSQNDQREIREKQEKGCFDDSKEPIVSEINALQMDDMKCLSEDRDEKVIVLESSSVPKSESEDKDWQRVSTKKQNHKRLNNPDVSQPSDSSSRVFCLSGDFGIQNTLLQMGLKIETPDGVRIHHLSTFGLKCAGCFKVTRKREKIFCGNCGNSTLYKVRLEIGERGIEVIGGLAHPPQQRGAKCSIPPPKGGKKNKDAILSEDVLQMAMQRYRNTKTTKIPDVFAPDYDEDAWFKTRVVKNAIRDQLPGRFGYPKGRANFVAQRKKR